MLLPPESYHEAELDGSKIEIYHTLFSATADLVDESPDIDGVLISRELVFSGEVSGNYDLAVIAEKLADVFEIARLNPDEILSGSDNDF